MVVISIPGLGLLFLQNKQVQTTISEFLTSKISEQLKANISISSVHYIFFKRLQIRDFYIEDQKGDTLIYAERTNIRFKRFRPDKQNVHIKKISSENAYIQIIMDAERNSSIQFLVDSLKRDIPPEEKTVLRIDEMSFSDSRFRRLDSMYIPKDYGIDFGDLDVRKLDVEIQDFQAKLDTTYMKIKSASGYEVTGFDLMDAGFDLTINRKFMTFSQGRIINSLTNANIPVVDFRFNKPKNFRQVFDSVQIYISSSNSLLSFRDVAYFFPQVKDLSGAIDLDGTLFGRLGDMKGENIKINYANQTSMEFDMRMSGLPETDSLFLDFDFRQLTSTIHELKELMSQYNIGLLKDTSRYQNLQSLSYRGAFTGYLTDFETQGFLFSNLGNITLDLNMKPDTLRNLHIKGSLGSDGFELGKLLDQEDKIGKINLDIQLDGVSAEGDLQGEISGLVDTLGLYGYNYSNIQLQGSFSKRRFDGSFFIRDPNIDLIFSGDIDFEREIPAYNFTVDVSNLRPYYLHLRDDDPEYFASFYLKTNLNGSRFDELNGEMQLVNSLFRRTGSQVQIYDILVSTENDHDTSYISLRSDMVDAEIRGKYKLQELPGLFTSVINDHFEIIHTHVPQIDHLSRFDYSLNLKDANPLLDFFFPRFNLAESIQINGNYFSDSSSYTFTCEGSFPYFEFSDFNSENLVFSITSDTGSLNLSIGGDQLAIDAGFEIKNPEIEAVFANNKNNLSIEWDNQETPLYAGNIYTKGSISRTSDEKLSYDLTILPSEIFYDNRKFILPHSILNLNGAGIAIDSFLIKGIDQYFMADGRYTRQPGDSITLTLSNINLGIVNELQDKFPLSLQGSLSGRTSLKQEYEKPVLTSNLNASGLKVNDQSFGNIKLKANWLREKEELAVQIISEGDSANIINATGSYRPKNDYLDFDVKLAEINLRAFQPYLEKNFNELEGLGDILLAIDGPLKDPSLNGNIFFRDASAIVTATKCKYFFTDKIRLYNNDLYFDDFRVLDMYGNSLVASGNITTSSFKNIYINVDLNASNFNFLSTTRVDNEQFYGDVYATARADLNGPPKKLKIKVAANTERHSNLKLPLYNATEIQKTDFISFIKKNESDIDIIPETPEPRRGITLDMDLDIQSNTTVQLIFDPKVGDIIEASGNGTLKLEIDEGGDLSMFGDVLIEDGEYLFTLQNVINKRFRVKPGGKISWNGAPTSAIIDLEAIYETKASTYSLAPEPTEDMKKRIPVQCLLYLQGDLSNPTISPKIVLPTAEPETRSIVQTSIGTDEELMRQFISLLVINNFISNAEFGANPIGGGSTGVAGVTASELLSNQLSNWLSQISNDFDIGVNYRPGDAISSDEVELALSTQLLNDRIIFSGNLDVLSEQVTTPSGEASNIVGDFDLEFRMSDKISIKAFNRVNDDRVVRLSLYTQGVGLQYRNEFNSISDFFGKKDKKNKKSEENAGPERNATLKEEE